MKVLEGWAIVRWRVWLSISALAVLASVGCNKSTAISISIAPSAANALINTSVQFVPTVTGSSNTIIWQVNSVTGGDSPVATPPTCGGTTGVTCYGTISTGINGGLYVAPSTVPANPKVTITATVSGTSTSTTATVTIISGVAINLSSASPTIGTGESFVFSASVTGVPTTAIVPASGTSKGCNSVSPNPPTVPACTAVTWTLNGAGTINATTGLYIAPNSIANGTSVVVTATSVYDTNVMGSAVVELVKATDPTLVSVGPNTGARGAYFEDVYLSGTNFITTTDVFINGVQVPAADLTVSSVSCSALTTTNTSGTSVPTPPCTTTSLTQGSTVIRVRVLDSFLASASFALPSTNAVSLVFTVARQQGSQVQCTPEASACQLVLSPVRPSIIGVTPDTITATPGSFQFTLDGGYYGTNQDPMVTAEFNGQPISASVTTISSANPDRQLTATVGSGLASQPGIYELSVVSDTPGLPPATSNLTVQPQYTTTVLASTAIIPVGKEPASISINTATGMAVVANQTSNDVTLINLATNTVVASICTVPPSAVPASVEPNCAASAPTGVAVDNVRNVALVTNSSLNTVSVVDLAQQAVTFYVNLAPAINAADNVNPANVSTAPVSVGINPLFAKALIAYRGANFGLILDLTPLAPPSGPAAAPDVIGVVNISTGANPRVAVAPNLNWALVTPGGLGALTIVNLSQQGTNAIAAVAASGVSRSSGTVTVTTTATTAIAVGASVLIHGVADPSFDGIYTVTSLPTSTTFTYSQLATLPNSTSGGGSLAFGIPVGSLATSTTITGVAVDDISSQAILADAGLSGTASIFNILDQSLSATLVSGTFPLSAGGMIGAAFNPLDDIAVTVSDSNATGYVISPGENGNPPAVLATFTAGAGPWDVAIDPGTDNAYVINQLDDTVTVVPLASVAIRTPQILQVLASCGNGSVPPASNYVSCGPGSNQVIVSSPLGSVPSPTTPVYLTITGSGFVAGTSEVRADGITLASSVISSREITATLPASLQRAPRRFAVDVSNTGTISNSLPLAVIQAVTLGATCPSGSNVASGTPSPIGVAVDAPNNVAVVTDINCNVAYLVNLAAGSAGLGQAVPVGSAPLGVAVSPVSPPQGGGLAVVANTGSTNVSLLNDLTGNINATITVEAAPTDVGIDPVLGQAIVTANGANDIDVLSTAGTSGETFSATPVGAGPVPVAVDPIDHVAAVGNQTAGTVSLAPLLDSDITEQTLTSALTTGIVYDPASDSFILESNFTDVVNIVNPATPSEAITVNVGISPTSMAYNFPTGTLVTANANGENITFSDLIADVVREVIPLTSSSEFAIAIHPTSNLAVVADGANSRILLLPLP